MDTYRHGSAPLAWFKSSHSDSSDSSACVEVAVAPAALLVRDSKDTTRPALGFAPAAWSVFVTSARS
ncbi:DUF397 domain-containing protein [Streptomyces sp. NPDC049954]|uniref:DUF397 domain-containing protein n=1 Tax=Streptomyces sp. NPDC049954 TaxID=3155779 RepID=UPI00341F282F